MFSSRKIEQFNHQKGSKTDEKRVYIFKHLITIFEFFAN